MGNRAELIAELLSAAEQLESYPDAKFDATTVANLLRRGMNELSYEQSSLPSRPIRESDVEWVRNSEGNIGVKISDQVLFMTAGGTVEYGSKSAFVKYGVLSNGTRKAAVDSLIATFKTVKEYENYSWHVMPKSGVELSKELASYSLTSSRINDKGEEVIDTFVKAEKPVSPNHSLSAANKMRLRATDRNETTSASYEDAAIFLQTAANETLEYAAKFRDSEGSGELLKSLASTASAYRKSAERLKEGGSPIPTTLSRETYRSVTNTVVEERLVIPPNAHGLRLINFDQNAALELMDDAICNYLNSYGDPYEPKEKWFKDLDKCIDKLSESYNTAYEVGLMGGNPEQPHPFLKRQFENIKGELEL